MNDVFSSPFFGISISILTFWIAPYQQTARAKFYQELIGDVHVRATPADGVAKTV